MAKRTFLNSILQNLTTDLSFGKSFFLGFIISASGSLVIGALHLFAIQISVEQGWQSAGNQILEWTMLVLFSILTIAVFYGAMTSNSSSPTFSMPSIMVPAFFLGMGIRFFYPSMIPFWLAWNSADFSSGEAYVF